MKHYFRSGGWLVMLLVLAGCTTPIGATKVGPRQAYEHLHQNALNSSQPSEDALKVLNRYDLRTAFEKNPDSTLATLQGIAGTDDRRDVLYALAELNYLNASRISRSGKPGVARHAPESYFAAAIYAYFYLEGASREGLPNPFDIRYRAAADFYNRGLALIHHKHAQTEQHQQGDCSHQNITDMVFHWRASLSRPRKLSRPLGAARSGAATTG